jgi:Protein of Unknown function (DUF2784)
MMIYSAQQITWHLPLESHERLEMWCDRIALWQLAMYQVVVAVAVALHFAFICYVVVGGFVALHWRRTIWLHMPTVLWGIAITAGHLDCPLTWLERWGRAKAGMAPLPPKGFIAHYVAGVLYPASWASAVPIAVFAVVAVSWVLYVWRGRHRDEAMPRIDRETAGGGRRLRLHDAARRSPR